MAAQASAVSSLDEDRDFNINNVVRRLPNLLAWLRAAQPDVVCLQELKAVAEGL